MSPPPAPSARYRLKFKKTTEMRFTGTLDLQRTLERTMRRAQLDVTYTLGFNPHPKMSLAAALPLGLTSECELADFWLDGGDDPSSVLQRLRQAQPPGLEIDEVVRVSESEPALPTQVISAEYLAEIGTTASANAWRDRVHALLTSESLVRERRGKIYDLRPLIERLAVEAADDGEYHLRMRLAARQGATGRPDEVLSALGLDPAAARICRTRLFLSERGTSAEVHP